MKQSPKNTGPTEAESWREVREEAEAIRREVAGLHGRLDIIETFLKLDIAAWKPTETQKEFAKQHGIKLPEADEV